VLGLSFGQLGFVSCRQSGAAKQEELSVPGVTVIAAEPRQKSIPLTGPGSVAPLRSVAVASRVDGTIVDVLFAEGKQVQSGELLALVDSAPFRIALLQAQAALKKDTASEKDARNTLDRMQRLYDEGIIPKQQLDTQAATVEQIEATLLADDAQVQSAELNLSYTRITAPFSGRAGLKMLDVGTIVRATDPKPLTTITQTRPIAILFALPEQSLAKLASSLRRGQSPRTEIYSEDDLRFLGAGKLVGIDNGIDQSTGLPLIKALVDNDDQLLWPAERVNVHVTIPLRDAVLVVPENSVDRDGGDTYVFVVKQNNLIEKRRIVILNSEGNSVGVKIGLIPGELVVTDSLGRLKSGMRVQVRSVSNIQQSASIH
jgi:multidrug efflux system membrane fusion protein